MVGNEPRMAWYAGLNKKKAEMETTITDLDVPLKKAVVEKSPRLELWTELERLHDEQNLAPPTATLTIEQLHEETARLQAQIVP